MDRASHLFFPVALLALGHALSGCCSFSACRWNGPPNDHFDGARFVNQQPTEVIGPFEFLKWQRERTPGVWKRVESAEPGPKPPARVEGKALRVTWVGHATLLVQTAGLNVLTDPIWSDRATPVSGVGPRRQHPPGLRFEDLPSIDAVLVSHNHYDHMDIATLAQLAERDHPRIFVGLGNAPTLEERGIEGAIELDWWQSAELAPGVVVHMTPAQHFSMRGLCDRAGTLWGGYVLATPGGNVFFAGDTGFGPHFAQIRDRLGAPRLALLPIGAYLPRWVMSAMHMDPPDAVKAHQTLGATTSIGMHFDTFVLSDESQGQAGRDLATARKAAGLPDDAFRVPQFGIAIEAP
jgi:L-ascorbate metabolism protein UlaG (beta-lactamase superfamily)